MAPRRVTEADAVRAFLDRGARPLEPFPGTQQRWRCRCLTCGGISAPRYSDVVNKGGGTCSGTCWSHKIARTLRRGHTEAASVMLNQGWLPLADYPGAGKPWVCRCAQCGAVKTKRLVHVRNGRASCTACGGHDVGAATARQAMQRAGLHPLVDYPGLQVYPWLARCSRCGHVGLPPLAAVRAHGHQCWSCRAGRLEATAEPNEQEAVASMLAHGFEPLASYPGRADAPWRSRCAICESDLDPKPTLSAVCHRTARCTTCARRSINPTAPGRLHLLVHRHLKALRWGIANSDHPLGQSGHYGSWSLAHSWDFPAAQDAWAFGYQVKLWVRGQGHPPASSLETADPVHWQESASLDDLPLDLAVAWVDDLVHPVGPDHSRDTKPASPGRPALVNKDR